MMKRPNYIFASNFFWQFKAQNHEELNSRIEDLIPEESGEFSWGSLCDIERHELDAAEWMDLIGPNISNLFDKPFKYKISAAWVNFYKKGHHQEVHSHTQCDLAIVYFPQDHKEGYSEFFFYNRNECHLSDDLTKLTDSKVWWKPKIKSGDMIVFPHSMLHGVTKHNHDDIRRSLSVNLKVRALDE